MKRNIFIVIFLMVGLLSCKSKKATAFREAIVQKDSSAFHILVGKEGLEEEKLTCLIKRDFKGALRAIDKQEQAFDSIIKEITILPADGIREGTALKTAAVNYYTSVRDLQLFDRQEIAAQEAMFHTNADTVAKAQDNVLLLTKEKLKMSGVTNEKRIALDEALKKFNQANNL
ncbi:hypothetical protein PV783_23050 [Chitinophaga sp. CC14]|uniref:hypothetical protein n=1 Tax=Chitinophaga sp. CC14 TaxID=3029199 RepID=UPI003B795E2C